jgi:hypothetical protein
MTMKRTALLLSLTLAGCRSASQQEELRSAARVSTMDSAMVRRLCAAPDSVLAGRRPCELLDQRLPPKVF